jgi:hypothetical protein
MPNHSERRYCYCTEKYVTFNIQEYPLGKNRRREMPSCNAAPICKNMKCKWKNKAKIDSLIDCTQKP